MKFLNFVLLLNSFPSLQKNSNLPPKFKYKQNLTDH